MTAAQRVQNPSHVPARCSVLRTLSGVMSYANVTLRAARASRAAKRRGRTWRGGGAGWVVDGDQGGAARYGLGAGVGRTRAA